jgi:gliding motility-associated-like protein
MAMLNDTGLSIIDNPNIYGLGCNFIINKIFLGKNNPGPVQFGLPHFIQNYFNPLANPYDFTRQGNCLNHTVTFKLSRLNNIDSVKWDFGDGQKSQQLQPLHNYLNAGFYNVQLIVYTTDCSGLNDTVNHKIWVAGSTGFLGKDTASCDLLSLDVGIDEIYAANYLWSTGSFSNRITTTTTGMYWLEVEQNGCSIRDSINIFAKPKPVVNIGPDTSICINKQIILNAANAVADSYLWNTGEQTPSITIAKEGTYYVTVTKNLCTASDTIAIIPGDCDLFIPNTFTPNKDGINDYFGVTNRVTVKDFSIKIYNRYGKVIFASNNIAEKWDGAYNGKLMPIGAYPWSIIYINGKGYTKWLNGTVLILH